MTYTVAERAEVLVTSDGQRRRLVAIAIRNYGDGSAAYRRCRNRRLGRRFMVGSSVPIVRRSATGDPQSVMMPIG